MWVSSPYFLTPPNLLTAASVVSVLGVMAVPETLLVIAGEIDISIGSVMAATSVILGLMVTQGLNVWLATVIALPFASGRGRDQRRHHRLFQDHLPGHDPGTYSIFLGIAYVLSNTVTVTIGGSGFRVLGSGNIGSIPVPVYFFLGLWVIGRRGPLYRAATAYLRDGEQPRSGRAGRYPGRHAPDRPFIAIALSAGVARVIVTSELGPRPRRSATLTYWRWSPR